MTIHRHATSNESPSVLVYINIAVDELITMGAMRKRQPVSITHSTQLMLARTKRGFGAHHSTDCVFERVLHITSRMPLIYSADELTACPQGSHAVVQLRRKRDDEQCFFCSSRLFPHTCTSRRSGYHTLCAKSSLDPSSYSRKLAQTIS